MQAKKTHVEQATKIYHYIAQNDHFLLSAHVNADGDAIASVLAMGLLLEKMDKHFNMVLHDQEVDDRFTYLKNYDKILHYSQEHSLKIENAIVLDVPADEEAEVETNEDTATAWQAIND